MSDIKKAADELSNAHPSLRAGIVLGLQLVQRKLSLTSEQNDLLDQSIDIVSGRTKYSEPAERPEEIKKINKEEVEEPTKDVDTSPKEEPKKEPAEPAEPKKDKPKIVRPWNRKDVIRKPRRPN